MQTFTFAARLHPEETGYTVTSRDLPEAITCGDDKPEALAPAADCMEEAIAARMLNRMDIPTPSAPRRGEIPVSLPAPMAAKAALYLALRQTGETHADLAKKLTRAAGRKVDAREIRRLLDPKHSTRLDRIHLLLLALGKRLSLSVEAAWPRLSRRCALSSR